MKPRSGPVFDLQAFLNSAGIARTVVEFRRKQRIFSQGDEANAVFYVQEGAVRLSVVSAAGKEAVVAMLGSADFFGEGCLAGQPLRMGTASAVVPTRARARREAGDGRGCCTSSTPCSPTASSPTCWPATSASRRTWSISSSTRARSGWRARCCCWPATARKEARAGDARRSRRRSWRRWSARPAPRVNFFMNKFRKLGFIEYNGGIQINDALLSVVLHE